MPTVIRQRREARHQRMLDARRAAAQQMSAAGSALAAGSVAAGAAARDGARAGLGAAGLALQTIWGVVVDLLLLLGRSLGSAARPLLDALARPGIGGPAALAGAIALGFGIGRYRAAGLDREAAVTAGIGIALLLASLPAISALSGIRLPQMPPRAGFAALGILVLAAGAAWFAAGGKAKLAGITNVASSIGSRLPLVGSNKPVQGRAEALSGDLLRVAGTTVRLAGLEAPERDQTCGTGGRRSRCGAAAEAALGRLVSGRAVSCTLSGKDADARPLAYCTRGSTDINAELVRQGHAFAIGGLFASYASHEKEARAAKAGMWAGGEPERPADYRARAGKGSSSERRADRSSRS